MKRITALLLALSLCLSLAACGGTGNETHDYIVSLLEKGEYDMAIYVIEGLRDGKAGNSQQEIQQEAQQDVQQVVPSPQQDSEASEYVVEQVPGNTGADWHFQMELVNDTGSTLTLEFVSTTDYLNGQMGPTSVFEGGDLGILPLGHLVLEPGQSAAWDDMRPLDYGFDRKEYLHIFRDEQGREVRFLYIFDMSGMMPEGGAPTPAPQQEAADDWTFSVVLENTSDTPWKLQAMDITHIMNGEPLGTSIFQGDELGNIGLGGLVLQPGQRQNYIDGHPVVSDWNAAEYRFHFVDGKGETQVLTFRFDDLDKQNQPIDYAQDPGRDLKTLRHDAAFEVAVSEGVYWVPAVTLGSSRYSNADIHGMLEASPEEKQKRISTLYEALQLYQVGNFAPSDDNVRAFEGGINWEHHKPGYHAVRTNTGCCATDSNWLRYILDGDYEEVGYIATSQRDGSGHIYNYILHEGWYYIIDLTHYHASGPLVTALESGDLNNYYTSDYILGNIHKVKDIQNYVDYVQSDFNDPPGLMFQYTAENCLAVDGTDRQIIYESNGKPFVQVIFDDPADKLEFVWKDSPKQLPDWSKLP